MQLHYVYLIRSVEFPEQFYAGLTNNVQRRLTEHNSGKSKHTSKFVPWSLVSAHYFADPTKAADFEKYLKSGSGRAFAKKRLR